MRKEPERGIGLNDKMKSREASVTCEVLLELNDVTFKSDDSYVPVGCEFSQSSE